MVRCSKAFKEFKQVDHRSSVAAQTFTGLEDDYFSEDKPARIISSTNRRLLAITVLECSYQKLENFDKRMEIATVITMNE